MLEFFKPKNNLIVNLWGPNTLENHYYQAYSSILRFWFNAVLTIKSCFWLTGCFTSITWTPKSEWKVIIVIQQVIREQILKVLQGPSCRLQSILILEQNLGIKWFFSGVILSPLFSINTAFPTPMASWWIGQDWIHSPPTDNNVD